MEFFYDLVSNWWGIALLCIIFLLTLLVLSVIFYRQFFKRFYDVVISGCALVVLFPVFFVLIILGAVKMKGNPFFTQLRPGKDEKVFKLIKFRTMTCETDENGKLLPDDVRLTRYGNFLRATSLDELPELLNIFIGDMSIIGPRPLMERYLPYYNSFEKKRHLVRPGLTGYAQSHGRNALVWEDRFALDVYYVENISAFLDIKILFKTVEIVLKHEGISLDDLDNFDSYRMRQIEENKVLK